ncbi:hypothetical protein Bbelb_179460 [Branchiostoma belcheri]|nr:hypothetical protein Bbelb_179460 [Branchiostoma belcheri]
MLERTVWYVQCFRTYGCVWEVHTRAHSYTDSRAHYRVIVYIVIVIRHTVTTRSPTISNQASIGQPRCVRLPGSIQSLTRVNGPNKRQCPGGIRTRNLPVGGQTPRCPEKCDANEDTTSCQRARGIVGWDVPRKGRREVLCYQDGAEMFEIEARESVERQTCVFSPVSKVREAERPVCFASVGILGGWPAQLGPSMSRGGPGVASTRLQERLERAEIR